MLIYKKGNLIDMALAGKFDVIVQGCNCQNTMGAGIAKEIRERLPDAWRADQATASGDYNKLGNYSVAYLQNLTVVNAYTQFHYMPRGVDHFEYVAFELILQKLVNAYPNSNFGFPYIGMGLAGGDKQEIMNLLEWFAENIEKTGGSATLVEFA